MDNRSSTVIQLTGGDVLQLESFAQGMWMRVTQPSGVSDNVFVPAQSVYVTLGKEACDHLIATLMRQQIKPVLDMARKNDSGTHVKLTMGGVMFVVDVGTGNIVGAQS